MSEHLLAGWALVRLGDVVEINPRGAHPGLVDSDLVTFVSMAAVEAGTGRADVSQVRPWSEVRKGYTTMRDGDVVFAKITPCMENGKVALLRGMVEGRGAGSTELVVLRPSQRVEAKYLLYFMLQESVRGDARAVMQGAAGQLRVPLSFLRELDFPIAPLAEQRRIVAALEEHLSALDSALAGLERARAHLSSYRTAVLEHVIRVQAGTGWRKATVGDLCEWSSGDYLPQKSFAPGVVPVYGGNGVSGTHAVPNVNAPTLVIGRVGAHCGNVHLTTGPAWITDNAIYAKRVDESLTLPFLGLVLTAARLNAKAAGSGQPFVNQRMLNATSIAVPALSEQRHIVEEVERCFVRANRVEDDIALQLVRASRLRQSILHRAFLGRLVKQDTNDEPVSFSSLTVPTAANRTRTRAAGRRSQTLSR